MLYELVGKQAVDFPDRETGEKIEGIKLHYLAPDEHVSGKMAATQFIRSSHPCYSIACDLAFGEFQFVYGPKGRILDVIQTIKSGPADKK